MTLLTSPKVHGLRGGSEKTWSYDPNDASTFWPREWLPYETGLKNVRIHSFGYDSDWSERQESPLTIVDFAQALLAGIFTSPHLSKNRKVLWALTLYDENGCCYPLRYESMLILPDSDSLHGAQHGRARCQEGTRIKPLHVPPCELGVQIPRVSSYNQF